MSFIFTFTSVVSLVSPMPILSSHQYLKYIPSHKRAFLLTVNKIRKTALKSSWRGYLLELAGIKKTFTIGFQQPHIPSRIRPPKLPLFLQCHTN